MNVRKSSFYFLIPIILLWACQGGSSLGDCEDCGFQCLDGGERNVVTNNCFLFDNCGFTYYPNSRIDTKESNGIAPGENNVFEFMVSNEAVEGIRQEITNSLIFETDATIRTFEINGKEFNSLNAHFKRETLNGNIDFVPARSGCIAGEEQASGVWFMYGKVQVPTQDGSEDMKFEARFDLPE